MSIGMVLLTAAAILVFFGVAQRVLDKLHLSDRMALLLIALMFFGTLLPPLSFGRITISLGGAVIPVGICAYLMIKADTGAERIRAVIGSVITAVLIYVLSMFMPEEPEAIIIDPLFIYGLTGGLAAYMLGRSRRCAFICGVIGVMLADTAVAIVNWSRGIDQALSLGGGGIFDAMVISGLLGVLLAECMGELMERIARGNQPAKESRVHNPVRQKEK